MKNLERNQFGSRVVLSLSSFTAGLLVFAFAQNSMTQKFLDQPVIPSLAQEQGTKIVTSGADKTEVQTESETVAARQAQTQGSSQKLELEASAQAPRVKKNLQVAKKMKAPKSTIGGDEVTSLAEDAFRAIDADLESADAMDVQSMAEELKLSKGQFRTIVTKQNRLFAKIQKAESRGSKYLKNLLIRDHLAWAREYLGPDRYQRYLQYNHKHFSQNN